jgi:hypothetical protein
MLRFKVTLNFFIALAALELSWIPVCALDIDTTAAHYYLMSYFNIETEGMKYAISTDGDKWENVPRSLHSDPITGGVGLGSWATQVEYDSISVTSGNQTLFADEFTNDASNWISKSGEWSVNSGVYSQSSSVTPAISVTHSGADWNNYTYRIKARKKGGNEGFLILFGMVNDSNYLRANIGGWGNTKCQFEKIDNGTATAIGSSINQSITLNQWYDIKIVITGARVQTYLDGKLLLDYAAGSQPSAWIIPTIDGKILRDPSLLRAKDGTYHCVWTSSWKSTNLGHATSKDLVHWSVEELPVMSKIPNTAMCWAPETFYDDIQNRYMIFWSSGVNGVCSAWYVTTTDFKTYSEPKTFFSRGDGSYGGTKGCQGAIDFYILKDSTARYILFYKRDDNTFTIPVNYYRIGTTPQGPWGEEMGPMIPVGINGEGPAVLKIGNEYRCYVDPQTADQLYYYSSTDLITWKQHATTLPFCHGTPIEIPRSMALWLVYNKSLDSSITRACAPAYNQVSFYKYFNDGKIAVPLEKGGRIDVSIIDLKGRVRYSQSRFAPAGTFFFNTGTVQLTPGIYYVSVALCNVKQPLNVFRFIKK